ncbi:MAG: flagellin [Bryobacteraceae bacterium]
MSISIQTNYASLVAAENLNTNSNFMTDTIQQLTSGYRINNSGDDPAGLAVANRYNSSIAELTQGVLNANDGTSILQIADGGLSNITQMLNQLKTLATQSASTTFTGSRANINVEYQQLITDITRQASNIGLNSGGSLNTLNSIYIGGGSTQTNAQVQINLSGASNTVDAAGLGIASSNVLGGGTELTGNTQRLDAPGAAFLTGTSQAFTFNVFTNNAATAVTATVTGGASGLTEAQVLSSLNNQLSPYGISAQVGSDGFLNFGGASAFTATTTAAGTGPIASTSSAATNAGLYNTAGAGTYTGVVETLTFQNGNGTATVSLTAGDNLTSALTKINAQTAGLGIYAVKNSAGTGVSIQSGTTFTASTTAANGTFTATGAQTVTAPVASSTVTGNALSAITSINSALSQLGNVQSTVGSGEMLLQYATDLANSQITNFSAAESRIRDADVAKEAANLSKAQVLEQSSVAAMAQANSAPQALLKLLQ